MDNILIRSYLSKDLYDILDLFYDAVHQIAAEDYSKEQLFAWAPVIPDIQRWKTSLESHHTFVAEQKGRILGFADLDGDYLDRLYVHPEVKGKGIASLLTENLEKLAFINGFSRITVHASITARGFFEKRGYRLIKKQQVFRKGVLITNFIMKKERKG